VSSPDSGRQTSQSSNKFLFISKPSEKWKKCVFIDLRPTSLLPTTYAQLYTYTAYLTHLQQLYCRSWSLSAVSGKPLSILSSEVIKADTTAGGRWVRCFRVTRSLTSSHCRPSTATVSVCRLVGGSRIVYNDNHRSCTYDPQISIL